MPPFQAQFQIFNVCTQPSPHRTATPTPTPTEGHPLIHTPICQTLVHSPHSTLQFLSCPRRRQPLPDTTAHLNSHFSVQRHPLVRDSCVGVTVIKSPSDVISSYTPVFRSGSCAEKGPKLLLKSMPISTSVIRSFSSLIAPKFADFPLKRFLFLNTYSSIAAENFLTHLQKDNAQIEKTLNTVKVKLDSGCITQVLERCAVDKPQLGVRFFIWAALHPTHRHTSYIYSKASKLLDLEKNPRILVDVIGEYKTEGFVVNLKMFKVLLNLCRAAQDADLGLWVLRKMEEFKCRPDTVSYNVVIRLLVETGRLDEAMGLMREMGLIDLYPDMVTYVAVVKGLCDAGRLEDASRLVKVMKGHGCVLNAVVHSMLLDGICMHGSLDMGLKFLGEMEKENAECKPNVITYTTMIKGFLGKGMITEALGVLGRMDDSGLKPNKVTFIYVLDALCKEGRVEEACEVVDKFRGGGVQYDELYNVIVMSLLRGGKDKEAEEMFRTMMSRGVRPNGLASTNIIKMIISEGGVLDGFSLFDALEKSGNLIGIDLELYSILLAELCRENHFIKAAEVVNIMIERGVRLKPSDAENIVKHLRTCGQNDLASLVLDIKN